MYILDTNVISELRKAKSGKANKKVINWAGGVPTASLYLSVITILELETGVRLIERLDQKQGVMLRTWLDNYVLPAFSERIIPIDTAVALCCASMHVHNPRPDRDALIAATAITHKMTMVSRNINDFKHMDVQLLNPWEEKGVA